MKTKYKGIKADIPKEPALVLGLRGVGVLWGSVLGQFPQGQGQAFGLRRGTLAVERIGAGIFHTAVQGLGCYAHICHQIVMHRRP